jgi:hypothetical protein
MPSGCASCGSICWLEEASRSPSGSRPCSHAACSTQRITSCSALAYLVDVRAQYTAVVATAVAVASVPGGVPQAAMPGCQEPLISCVFLCSNYAICNI